MGIDDVSTSWMSTETGGATFIVAMLSLGQLFRLDLQAEEAMANLRAFAEIMGFEIQPCPL